MNDPTFVREDINNNPVWELAFTMSEISNDNAPIGWGQYIYIAELLLNKYDIKSK